jgi:hypothetical protein
MRDYRRYDWANEACTGGKHRPKPLGWAIVFQGFHALFQFFNSLASRNAILVVFTPGDGVFHFTRKISDIVLGSHRAREAAHLRESLTLR